MITTLPKTTTSKKVSTRIQIRPDLMAKLRNTAADKGVTPSEYLEAIIKAKLAEQTFAIPPAQIGNVKALAEKGNCSINAIVQFALATGLRQLREQGCEVLDLPGDSDKMHPALRSAINRTQVAIQEIENHPTSEGLKKRSDKFLMSALDLITVCGEINESHPAENVVAFLR